MKRIYLTDKKVLAYFEQTANSNYWDRHWNIYDFKSIITSFKSDGIFVPLVKQKLPKGSKILEGGCGLGQMVYALKYQGFNPIGVDFAPSIVKKVNKGFPELDIRLADVRELPFKDDEFDGYISVGVIEHLWMGYEEIISEMKRVLKPHGLLFISFPYMSPIRKLKAKLKMIDHVNSNDLKNIEGKFYQFALRKKSVLTDLTQGGFSLEHSTTYAGLKGFKDEFGLFKLFLQPIYDAENLGYAKTFFNLLFKSFASHCSLMVLRNNK